jgi:hypothetical protein
MRFPHLAHRSAAAHKLHSTTQQDGPNVISGNDQNQQRRYRPLAYSSPETVQTTEAVASWRGLAAWTSRDGVNGAARRGGGPGGLAYHWRNRAITGPLPVIAACQAGVSTSVVALLAILSARITQISLSRLPVPICSRGRRNANEHGNGNGAHFEVWASIVAIGYSKVPTNGSWRRLTVRGRIVPGTAEEVDASELDMHGRYDPQKSQRR